MKTPRICITIDASTLAQLDELVKLKVSDHSKMIRWLIQQEYVKSMPFTNS